MATPKSHADIFIYITCDKSAAFYSLLFINITETKKPILYEIVIFGGKSECSALCIGHEMNFPYESSLINSYDQAINMQN